MAFYNGFGDGETEAKAAGPTSRLVSAVESFKEIIEILRRDRIALVGHCQQTVAFAALFQSDPGGACLAGIFLRVIQQDIYYLAQFRGITVNPDILSDIGV